MPPDLHFDLAQLDFSNVVADLDAIRKVNPQRHEMEQIDGVVLLDYANKLIVGYKDVRYDEFWVRGHMPGYPLLPGVLMCEASAQLCSYYTMTQHEIPGDFLGFSGLENVRFRSPVRPGERLILVAKELRFNRRQMIFNVQGFVVDRMVFHGDIIGVPLKRGEE
ncbi:MAG: beta-hydroxyacyl-ACP dehydratase [Planctomycetes bacterium]|jgi:3-hydroxyacyl-[acyl-carrier-protein] dehydratase|nr:beta-hydroxyacyl-ACP dehydratase [Planctomycetota bacterium]